MLVGTDGLGFVAYGGAAGTGLRVVHCENEYCTAFAKTTLDTAAVTEVAVAVGSATPYVAYRVETGSGSKLKVARCWNTACTSASTAVLDPGDGSNLVGDGLSIAVAPDGRPVISHHRGFHTAKLARCDTASCATASSALIATDYSTDGTSVAIGSDGLPLVAYVATTPAKEPTTIVHCENASCTSHSSTEIWEATQIPSLALGSNGFGIMVAYDYSIGDASGGGYRFVYCQNVPCSSFGTNVLEPGDATGASSVAVGLYGRPVVAYTLHDPDRLLVTLCRNLWCSSLTRKAVEPNAGVSGVSLAVAPSAKPIMAYRVGAGPVKVAACYLADCGIILFPPLA
jgi:hypothetical protein